MLRRESVDWSCELVFRGESYGWDVAASEMANCRSRGGSHYASQPSNGLANCSARSNVDGTILIEHQTPA